MQLRHLSSALALLLVTSCGESGESGPQFAYVTNGVADFWTNAEAGALAGGEEYGVDVTVLMPAGGTGYQPTAGMRTEAELRVSDDLRQADEILTLGRRKPMQ